MIKNLLKILFQNPVFANILMALIVLAGGIASLTMVRETFPRFSLDVITVSVAYPGADPEEVEEGICLKIEEALDGIEGVKEVVTMAKEGGGTGVIECDDDANVLEVKDDVETRIEAITTFPRDAEKPIVEEVKFRGEVLSLAVWGDLPERQLKEVARQIEQELLRIKGLTQTAVRGTREYEIAIEVSEESLRRYGLNFRDVSKAVADNAFNLPAGNIRTENEEIRVRTLGRKYLAKDYRGIPVLYLPDGSLVTLEQVAEIKDTFDQDAQLTAMFNGKPAVSIEVYKTETEDAIDISAAIDEFIAAKNAELPDTIHLSKFKDHSRMVTDRLSMLIENGMLGLCLVVFSLWLFLSFRLSFWVSMGIPISVAGGLAIMAAIGGSINMLSLFGLIMVLGLIVDDAIVVGESIFHKRHEGMSAIDAAAEGTAEVALPVIAAVLTTIIAFVPLFFVGGVMGKFIRQIPIPVVAALSVSLIEGLFILPVHLRHLPVADKMPERKCLRLPFHIRSLTARMLDFFIDRVYSPFLARCLRWRYVVFATGLLMLLLIAGLVRAGVIKYVLMPRIDNDFIRAKIELPAGTPLSKTSELAKRVMNAWSKVEKDFTPSSGKPLTVAVFAMTGGSLDWRESSGQSNVLEVSVELLPSEERDIHYLRLVTAWRDAVGDIPGAVATNFGTFQHGPGGTPIEMKLFGDNQRVLLAAADELLNKLDSLDGVFDAQLDYRPGKREFVLTAKDTAYHHGLSLNDIARYSQGAFYGNESMRIQRGRDDIRVKIKYPESNSLNSVATFKNQRVKTPDGERLPLASVAEIAVREGQSVINRKNKRRMVSITADVDDDKANAAEIVKELERNFIPELTSRHDVSYVTEGQAEESRESLSSLLIGFPLALFGIYFIIASIFRSYLQPVIIMATIPFGLIGAVIGHMIFNIPLCLMSLFGMVALAGIVVNDAIVLIEGINIRLGRGYPLFAALIEGGKRRFRAILLTTLTTFIGLMPLILEKSMQAQFLIPMAISIAFGVLFATVVTLVVIPCLVVMLNDIRRLCHLIWFLRLPPREAVEPRCAPPKA